MLIYRKNPLLDANQTISRFRRINARLERAQEIAITGLAVQRPSDAPGRWGMIHGLRASLADQQRWQEAMNVADDLLLTADDTLDAVSASLQSLSDLAVQYASETYSAEDRAAASGVVATLGEDLVSLANTKIGDRYLFAGDNYHETPFTSAGVYRGSAATAAIQIGNGINAEVALDGSEIFQGTVDVFQVVGDLAVALANNDTAGITTAIEQIEQASQQVTTAWTEVGYRQTRVIDARTVASNMELVLTERLSVATEADVAEAYTNLSTLQTSYEAALQVTAASSGAMLFDLL